MQGSHEEFLNSLSGTTGAYVAAFTGISKWTVLTTRKPSPRAARSKRLLVVLMKNSGKLQLAHASLARSVSYLNRSPVRNVTSGSKVTNESESIQTAIHREPIDVLRLRCICAPFYFCGIRCKPASGAQRDNNEDCLDKSPQFLLCRSKRSEDWQHRKLGMRTWQPEHAFHARLDSHHIESRHDRQLYRNPRARWQAQGNCEEYRGRR